MTKNDALFSLIGYDQSKKKEILECCRTQMGSTVTVESLNARFDKGLGVEYYDENVNLSSETNSNSSMVKYIIFDTGIVSKIKGATGNVCISLVKIRGTWTGGYVDLKDNIVAQQKEYERGVAARYNTSNDISVAVKNAYQSGKSATEINNIVSQIKETNMKSGLALAIPTSTLETIKEYMLDCGEGWDIDSLKQLMGGLLIVARSELQEGRACEWLKVNERGDKIVLNSGFIGDDYDFIYLLADLDQNTYKITNVNVLESPIYLKRLGFKDTEYPSGWLCSNSLMERDIPFENVDFSDRLKIKHCIKERSFRGSEVLDKMSVREIRDRIRLSLELGIKLHKRGIRMVEPVYYIKGHRLSYCLPFYASADMDISKPDAALFIGDYHGEFTVYTLIDIKGAYNNVLTLDRYPQAAWLKNMKVSDIISHGLDSQDITMEEEE